MDRLRDARGRFRARGPLAGLPGFVRKRDGRPRLPVSVEMQAIGLRREELPEYARLHLDPADYLDFLEGLRDGNTKGMGVLL